VSYIAEGGTISADGLFFADSTPGNYTVVASALNGQVADTARIVIEALPAPPPPAFRFPGGYDPARLGNELVVGDCWQGFEMGADEGYTSLLAKGWRQSASPYPKPEPGQLMLENDPVFGKVAKFVQPGPGRHPSWHAGTLEHLARFPAPLTHFWYRAVVRLDGNGNPKGFTSSGTGVRGGSSTWKMMFVFSTGDKNRMDLVLMADGGVQQGGGQPGDNSVVALALPQGGAPSAPEKGHFAGEISLTQPNTPGIGSDLLTSKEWFELVMNFEQEDETHYIQRYFIRQLTVGGGTVWAPRSAPTWRGHRSTVTSGKIASYYRYHLGGNKSQSNDGPNDQFVRWGPWEITTAKDPYGWDKYGK
jgi:hypothetical protein